MKKQEPPKSLLSTRLTKVFAEYFPNEAITKRLINWLYLSIVWNTRGHEQSISPNTLIYPRNLIGELKIKGISPESVMESRYGGMFDKHHFEWFEESELFYLTFLSSIIEEGFSYIKPLPINARRIENCVMLFDGIYADSEAKCVFLLNAKNRWNEFRPIIETLNWIRRGEIKKNTEAIRSSFQRTGSFEPVINKYFDISDPYLDFMVYIFSQRLNQRTVKNLSTHAKKIIRQSQARTTKGKSQVNVLINNQTIEKFENLCEAKNLSKAKLITELIENYAFYRKEIDAAIQKAKIGVLKLEDLNPPKIMQPFSPKEPSQSWINTLATTENKTVCNTTFPEPTISPQRFMEHKCVQDASTDSASTENFCDSTQDTDKKIPSKNPNKLPDKSKEEIRNENRIKSQFCYIPARKKN